MVMEQADLDQRLIRAVESLLRGDGYLLEHDANERSITHRLAMHLVPEFDGWNVDCEYNRDGHEPKRLNLPRRHAVADDDEHATTVFPDIIVHRRGTQQNLLVIEAKKSTNPDDGAFDRRKLRAFADPAQLGYQFAVFVLLYSGTNDISATLEFPNGRKIRCRPGRQATVE